MPSGALDFKIRQTIPATELIRIAEEAGKIILEVYSNQNLWQVEHKDDERKSPLTQADLQANTYICQELAQLAPHIPIISEENKAIAYSIRKGYQCFWCVDPLDGTKEFVKRNGQFTVNIALVEGSTSVMGVVHVPVQAKTYWAAKGQGAYLRQPGEAERRLQCAEYSLADANLVLVGSASHGSDAMAQFVERFKEPELKQLGSSLKLLMVAEGSAHIYPRLAPTCEWDTAAAHVCVTEAGGQVVQAGVCDRKGKLLEDWQAALARGEPVVYNKEDDLNPFFVVYGKAKN